MKASSAPRVCYFLSNYVSHRRAGLDYRDCIKALGIELVDHPRQADIVILHNEPWSYAQYFRAYPELRDRYVIAYTVWETDRLPLHYQHNLALVDEAWTCSRYCQDVLSPFCRRTSLIPHVVKPPSVDPLAITRMKERIGFNDSSFYFYSIANARNPRKALRTALESFGELFSESNARFIVKSNGPLPQDLPRPPGLIEIPEQLCDQEIDALHHVSQAFVSTHHSEGWGLGLSEAMACGNLALATGYSGNMEFMNAQNSLPVDYRVGPIAEKDLLKQPGLLSSEMQWAHIDQNDLRLKMLECYEYWPALRHLRQQARRDLRRYRPERIALSLDLRLNEILLDCSHERQRA